MKRKLAEFRKKFRSKTVISESKSKVEKMQEEVNTDVSA